MTEEIKDMIIDGLYDGLRDAIQKCKPEPNAKPMQNRIEDYYSRIILARYFQLHADIDSGKMSEIEAIIKAPDLTSHLEIHPSFYLPLRMQIP